MGLADEMRRLTEHFRQAYEGRVEAVAAIRSETAQDLARLHAAHQEMAAALRRHLADAQRNLADAERSRRAEAAGAARERAGYVESLRVSVASTLKGLRKDFSEARRIWVELSEFMGRARARAGAPSLPGIERLAPRKARRGFKKG